LDTLNARIDFKKGSSSVTGTMDVESGVSLCQPEEWKNPNVLFRIHTACRITAALSPPLHPPIQFRFRRRRLPMEPASMQNTLSSDINHGGVFQSNWGHVVVTLHNFV